MNSQFPDNIWIPEKKPAFKSNKQINVRPYPDVKLVRPNQDADQILNCNYLMRVYPEPSPDYNNSQIGWVNNPVFPRIPDSHVMRPPNYLQPLPKIINSPEGLSNQKPVINTVLPPVVKYVKRDSKSSKCSKTFILILGIGTALLICAIIIGAVLGVLLTKSRLNIY